MVKWIILSVLLLPVGEFATFVLVAWLIGFGWALALMLATSIAGFVALRWAGRGPLAQFRDAVAENGLARFEANTAGLLTVLGGIMLILPGFLTDLAGALLLIGPLQRRIVANFDRAASGGRQSRRSAVIDLKPDEWRQMPDRESQGNDRHADRR